MNVANIFNKLPADLRQEAFGEILRRNGLRLERIVSKGHATPAGEWYDQKEHEWVLLVSGSAGLRIENEPESLILKPGDFLNLPAHVRHRVEWPATETIWLALHYHD